MQASRLRPLGQALEASFQLWRKEDIIEPTAHKTAESPTEAATAIVYCEANFGAINGKTANGLVRHSELYKILSVIDSEKAGLDAGVVLGEPPKAIPICRDLADALASAGTTPATLFSAWLRRAAGCRPAIGRFCWRPSTWE